MPILAAAGDALEKLGTKVEEVGFKYIPGFDKFDKAMQKVADTINDKLGLEPTESADSTFADSRAGRSDAVDML